jgi:hypothetical protein
MNQPTRAPARQCGVTVHPPPVGAQCGMEVTRLGIAEKFRFDGRVTVVAYRATAQIRVTDET